MDHVPVARRTVDTTSTQAAGRRRGYRVSLRGLGGRRAWALGPVLAIPALSCYLKSNDLRRSSSERADHRPRRGLTSFDFACFDSRVRDVPRGIRYVIGRVRVGFIPHGPFGDLTPYRTMRECKVYSAGPRSARSSGRDSGLEGAPSFANLLSGQISLVQVIH